MVKSLIDNKIVRLFKWIKYLKNTNYKRDTWYFVLSYGVGDTYIASAFFSYLIARGDKVVALLTKESHQFIPHLFSSVVEVRVQPYLELELIEEFGKIGMGYPIILHPYNVLNGRLSKALGYRHYNIADMYKLLLGIDMRLPPMPPVPVIVPTAELEDIFTRHNLPVGRTVLLCPKANSVTEISAEFWLELANRLAKQGLQPVFMNSDMGGGLYNNIEFSLYNALAFCNRAGYVVSLRSGFCDLIATTTAATVVLYPDQLWYSGPLFNSTSLIDMGLCDARYVREIVYKFDSDFTSLQNTILQYFA